MLSHSVVSDSATPWTAACQAPLSIEFSRQEYWIGLLFPSPGDLLNPEFKPASLVSPELADIFLTTEQGRGRLFSTYRHVDNNLLHDSS